jgi:hypothetical protein
VFKRRNMAWPSFVGNRVIACLEQRIQVHVGHLELGKLGL